MKLVEIIQNGMAQVNAQRTQETLGDRTEYIGASDLGQCPRKVLLSKVFGEDPDLETLVRYERGHLTESILANALEAQGYFPERQVELERETENGTPLKFHLDFVFKGRYGDRFAILEAKSTTPIPHNPYEGWEMQLHAQMGLAQAMLGNEVQVEGAIFALDMAPKKGSTGYGAWNGYKASPEFWASLQEDADTIYQAVQQHKKSGNLPDDLPCRPGPLCSYCQGLKSCPIFSNGDRADELRPQVSVLVELQQKRKRISQFEDAAKDELKAILRDRGWVSVAVNGSDVKLKVNQKTSRRTDFRAVKAALESYGDSLDAYTSNGSYEELMVKGG